MATQTKKTQSKTKAARGVPVRKAKRAKTATGHAANPAGTITFRQFQAYMRENADAVYAKVRQNTLNILGRETL